MEYYEYAIKDITARVNFFNGLDICDVRKLYYNVSTVLVCLEYVSNQYLKSFTYKDTLEAVEKVYNSFNYVFKKKNLEVEKLLAQTSQQKTYNILVLKDGAVKYCEYKLKQKRINDFKAKLKKIKLINSLNNFIKGRK